MRTIYCGHIKNQRKSPPPIQKEEEIEDKNKDEKPKCLLSLWCNKSVPAKPGGGCDIKSRVIGYQSDLDADTGEAR